MTEQELAGLRKRLEDHAADKRWLPLSPKEGLALFEEIDARDGVLADVMRDDGFRAGQLEERRRIVELVREMLQFENESIDRHAQSDRERAVAHAHRRDILDLLNLSISPPDALPEVLPPDRVRAENERLRAALKEVLNCLGVGALAELREVAIEALGE